MSTDKPKVIKNTISFPVEIYEKIKQLADQERRSVNQQVVRLCELALETLETGGDDDSKV